ncbi:NAD(P)H-flavin reductase [Halobacillus dabanensis]|uniref:NAD(P)H-flavin reductase n=1 Tax=Halobacillus dabanensis TaxID=240302 RepID=A0A1I3WB84_HALDA|nr:FAD-dependent oxidoreductase [Halobacillus dabanensis]SFK04722.1 NAD(P)H-flavin reductase [Halobacillus dabanensis]
MSFFQDALAMFKKRDLLFLESYKETEDVYTFLFQKENDLNWKAGQHGLFTITHKKIKNKTRPFTVASAPAEGVVRISTRISEKPSEFKQAMLELKQGMTINMTGPLGSFNPEDNKPSLLIAGGIGITPFRSILKQIELEEKGIKKPMQLLYLDSNKSFIFKDELDAIANHPLISVTYLDSRDGLYQEIDTFTTLNEGDGQYFIAGSKSMVKSISDFLKSNQVPKKNIKKDAFYGY